MRSWHFRQSAYSIRPTESLAMRKEIPRRDPAKNLRQPKLPNDVVDHRRRGPVVTRRARGRPSLTLEQRGQLFWDRERHDLERYSRLTERQRRQPYSQLRERQWHKAALLTLMAGGELPKSLARMWAPVRLDSADVGDPIGPRTYAC
jgi:hypothetical protein